MARIQEVIEGGKFVCNERKGELFLGEIFEQLVRRNSLQQKCEDCTFEATNKAGLKFHIKSKRRFKCEECCTLLY